MAQRWVARSLKPILSCSPEHGPEPAVNEQLSLDGTPPRDPTSPDNCLTAGSRCSWLPASLQHQPGRALGPSPLGNTLPLLFPVLPRPLPLE